ncbi:Major facilitator superfamily [Kalmanozyma brasiliensis GHG001]|uniref:Major facilitator superfamily (MFS) profile domain-containing protein n=1 Tax=Kalmanozyma brasiliensis (strain GHG001) TaxID=1365824 RepID=V5F2G3_KALBG|nr:Major facilitator superfamily [Kalmanozyma brasiliensis GHG001]EST09569.1 Major facilitator superfamily [Kalmanozyma brasiliensis GHG001]
MSRPQETTPLLSGQPRQADTEDAPPPRTKATPLPRKQLFVLCLMRMTEPISFTVIFPFVNAMLRANLPSSVPSSRLGYYAGLVESAFAFVQFLTIFFWARLSDRIGRKPVLLIGLFGSFLSVNAFGFARTFPQMVLARSIAGLMNGNIAILKSVLAEVTDETNQARAFSLIPLCFAVGSIVGNGLGGWLVGVWGGEGEWLENHPFWLPCGVASAFNLCAIITGTLFLKETLPKKTNKVPEQGAEVVEEERPPSIRSLLAAKSIRRILGTQLGLNFLNACHAALLPLFCYTAIEQGGLSFTSADIGTVLALNGGFTIFIQLIAFPTLERRLGGPARVYVRVTAALPFLWLCLPLAHQLAINHSKAWPMAALVLAIVLKGISNMSIVSSNLLVNNSAPTRSSLATLNSVSQMAGCLSRTIGPSFSTSLFAFSTSRGVLGGQLVWLVMWAISAGTWIMTMKVRAPEKASWRVKARQEETAQRGTEARPQA